MLTVILLLLLVVVLVLTCLIIERFALRKNLVKNNNAKKRRRSKKKNKKKKRSSSRTKRKKKKRQKSINSRPIREETRAEIPPIDIDETRSEKKIIPLDRPRLPSNENQAKNLHVDEIIHLIDTTDLVLPCDKTDSNRMKNYEFELIYDEEHLFR